MLLQQFPDLQWLKKQAEERFANRKDFAGRSLPTAGWPTVVMNVKAADVHRDNIRGPLSIFTNFSGTSHIEIGGKKSVVNEGFFYLSNHDQHYTLSTEKKQITETCNIHFGEYWADQAIATVIQSPEKIIDNRYFIAPHDRIEFYNMLFKRSAEMDALLSKLRTSGDDALLEEEILYALLVLLVNEHETIRKAEHRLPLIKNSTRQEIIKQLNQSSDYIHSFYNKPISLDELAEVAAMSKFHFLRLFKVAFNKTPHQFINDVKMERAKMQLKNKNIDVISVSRELGFKDASTFSRAFKRSVGAWPSEFRN